MKYLTTIMLIFVTQFALAASTGASKKTDPPKHAMVCMKLYSIAKSAFDYKKQGKTEAEMLAPLPSKKTLAKYPESRGAEKLLGEQMIAVIEDIYGNDKLPYPAYASYRAESCYRTTVGLPVHENLSTVKSKLFACAKLSQDEQVKCGNQLAKP